MTVLATKRLTIQLSTPAEIAHMTGEAAATDVAMLVYWDGVLVAWTDDYGTARHPDHELDPELKDLVERYVEAAGDLWAVLDV